MQRFLAAILCGFLALSSPVMADAPIPYLEGHVVDTIGVLSGVKDQLSRTLDALRIEKGVEVVVLVVDSTKPEEIEQYGARVFTKWKLGRPGIDDGLIFITAVTDRRTRIEVGRGLEGDIPDVIAHRIIEEQVIPRFKNDDLTGGIVAGTNAIVNIIQGVPLPPPAQRRSERPGFGPLVVFLIFAGNFLAAIFGTLLGAALSGLAAFFIVWSFWSLGWGVLAGLFAALIVLFREPLFGGMARSTGGYRYGRGGGGFYGGYGGGWGGSSGSSGGFSGMGSGGTFSGGGASGRW